MNFQSGLIVISGKNSISATALVLSTPVPKCIAQNYAKLPPPVVAHFAKVDEGDNGQGVASQSHQHNSCSYQVVDILERSQAEY